MRRIKVYHTFGRRPNSQNLLRHWAHHSREFYRRSKKR